MSGTRSITIAIAASAALGLSFAASAETAGEYIDDTTLTATTKTALVDSDAVSANDINVEVYKGHIQLSGFVGTDAEEAAALAIAKGIEGNKGVIDAIAVLPGDRTMGQAVDDTTIQTKLKAGLADAEGLGSAVAINTEVRQGHVLLAGFVDSEQVRKTAGDIAGGIDGVKKVHNYITVKP